MQDNFNFDVKDLDFTFVPVNVQSGRKFRGFGYLLSGGYTYRRGYHNSGVDPLTYTDYSKIWDPETKTTNYVNDKYPTEAEGIPEEKILQDKRSYVLAEIESTEVWCRAKSPNEAEARRFTRNCLLKRHPELREIIDTLYPDERDVVEAVKKTLQWAVNLRSRPMTIYGKSCPGGKPYPKSKVLRIARNSLAKHGYDKIPGFEEAWELTLEIMGLK